MANRKTQGATTRPILRLRHPPGTKTLDGPWLRSPDLILSNEIFKNFKGTDYGMDITMDEYRPLWMAEKREQVRALRGSHLEDIQILNVVEMARSTNMGRLLLHKSNDEITEALEKYYVNAHIYLNLNGRRWPPPMIESFGEDWGWNARGVYYRHYQSPEWVTGDHSLWIPSTADVDWKHPQEKGRRSRAQTMLKHIIANEKWTKGEYAWEADAWTDVFGQMRDDPAIAADKHEYNTVRQSRHPVSCLMTGQSAFLRRIPDATFGLATFHPRDYQTPVASYDLDYGRLQALLLHRHCGLISDPRWGESDLVFPFAVYEAKGWSGDSRDARRKACAAAAAYLDILDDLARWPGKLGRRDGAYQTAESRSTQTFVFTSFGAHWHILVGYRRPRLAREFAGRKGMSENVYLFQRIWSGRVITERCAWELLYLVDQIHEWGVTDFRDFVIRHLKPWHEFAKKCYVSDFDTMTTFPGHQPKVINGDRHFPVPLDRLPEWTRWLNEKSRSKFQDRAKEVYWAAGAAYNPGTRQASDEFSQILCCTLGDCGDGLGFPLTGVQEIYEHLKSFHTADLDGDGKDAMVISTKEYVTLPIAETPRSQRHLKRSPDFDSASNRGIKRGRL
ncbi:hypothetical protein F4802DRAFT_588444, partial [Xylaria palmicola]